MHRYAPLDVDYIRKRLRVDINAGKIYWVDASKHHARLNGKEAGTARTKTGGGFAWIVKLDGKAFQRSHLIFAVATGKWPSGVVSHRNDDTLDDRSANLYERPHGSKTHDGVLRPGQRFGLLTTVRIEGLANDGHKVWLCQCDCGAGTRKQSNNLQYVTNPSCGCDGMLRQIESHKTHGMRFTSTYRSWQAAKTRCHNPSARSYSEYGAKGVSMCDEWRDSFEAFYAYMGDRPDGTSLDRYPNWRGNYEPGNCRWATQSEQMRNTWKSVWLQWKGKDKAMPDIAKELGISNGAAHLRYKRGKLYGPE